MCIIQQIACVLLPINMGIIRCFTQFYWKHLVMKAVCLMDGGKFIKMKINVLQASHFTAATWQKVTVKTHVSCFCLCGYGQELNRGQSTCPSTITVLPKHTLFLALLNNSLMYTGLTSRTNRTFWTWNLYCFIWNIRFQTKQL